MSVEFVGVREVEGGFEAFLTRQGSEWRLGVSKSAEEAADRHDLAIIKVAVDEYGIHANLDTLPLNSSQNFDSDTLEKLRSLPWEVFYSEMAALVLVKEEEIEDERGIGVWAEEADGSEAETVESQGEEEEEEEMDSEEAAGATEGSGTPAESMAVAARGGGRAGPVAGQQGEGRSTVWWESEGGGWSRQLGFVAKSHNMTMPVWVVQGLGLEGRSVVQVFHRPSGEWWRVKIRPDATLQLSSGLPALMQGLKLTSDSIITLRPIEASVAYTSPTAASPSSGPACLEIIVETPGTQPPCRMVDRQLGKWVPCAAGGDRCFQLDLTSASSLVSLSIPGYITYLWGLKSVERVLVRVEGGHGDPWPHRVGINHNHGAKGVALTARWAELVRDAQIQRWDTIRVAPDPTSAAQPALVLAVQRPAVRAGAAAGAAATAGDAAEAATGGTGQSPAVLRRRLRRQAVAGGAGAAAVVPAGAAAVAAGMWNGSIAGGEGSAAGPPAKLSAQLLRETGNAQGGAGPQAGPSSAAAPTGPVPPAEQGAAGREDGTPSRPRKRSRKSEAPAAAVAAAAAGAATAAAEVEARAEANSAKATPAAAAGGASTPWGQQSTEPRTEAGHAGRQLPKAKKKKKKQVQGHMLPLPAPSLPAPASERVQQVPLVRAQPVAASPATQRTKQQPAPAAAAAAAAATAAQQHAPPTPQHAQQTQHSPPLRAPQKALPQQARQAQQGAGSLGTWSLEPHKMVELMRPVLAVCGAPASVRAKFLRLFINRMPPQQQVANYQEIMGMGVAGDGGEGVREWVEGTVEDMQAAAGGC